MFIAAAWSRYGGSQKANASKNSVHTDCTVPCSKACCPQMAVLQAMGQRKEQGGTADMTGFLRGVVLLGDLQVKPHMLPDELSVGINNASHFGEQFRKWP